MLIEKYMTLIRFSNNGQTFVNMRSNYFHEKAGLSEQDMVTLRQIEETIPESLSDPDFESDEESSWLRDYGFDEESSNS